MVEETRSYTTVSSDNLKGRVLTGLAIPVGKLSEDLGGFRERIMPGAYLRSVADAQSGKRPILALIEHNPDLIVGNTQNGTLQLWASPEGLRFKIKMPDTTYATDRLEMIRRGDVAGMSFKMVINKSAEKWKYEGGRKIRELYDIDVLEITITCAPAYPDTTVATENMRAWESGDSGNADVDYVKAMQRIADQQ